MILPYGLHAVDQTDIDAVTAVLRGDWLTGGNAVSAFEKAIAQYVGSSYVLACSNGTTALHLAMLGLGIGEGDVVFVPAITFLASANAARYVGAHVVFVDVEADTGLMSAHTLEQAIRDYQKSGMSLGRMRAVVNVHLAGQCHDLSEIANVAKQYDLWVIEDAAHAIGTSYYDKEGVGHAIGGHDYCDVTTFSFHPVKTVTTGEGGAVTTKHPDVFSKMMLYRSHGMIKDKDVWQNTDIKAQDAPWYYEMQDLGYNYRISDINCALGITQLQKLDLFKHVRCEHVAYYDEAFASSSVFSMVRHAFSDTSWHLYVVFLDYETHGYTRGQVMNVLKQEGIGTQVHYIPLYHQPYYKHLYGNISLQGAEHYYARCLSLPLYPKLTHDDMDHVVEVMRRLFVK